MDDEEDKDEVYLYFWFEYDLDRNNIHLKFNPTEVRTHDLQIIGSTFIRHSVHL